MRCWNCDFEGYYRECPGCGQPAGLSRARAVAQVDYLLSVDDACAILEPPFGRKSIMEIKIPGDRTRAACETCQKLTSATWRYGDLPMDSGEVAHDVMQAYCDMCGASLLVAQQSAHKIRQTRQEKTSSAPL